MTKSIISWIALITITCMMPTSSTWAAFQSERELIGLWKAKRTYGPGISGVLTVIEEGNEFIADIAGYSIPMSFESGNFTFSIPSDGKGEFRGAFSGAFQNDQADIAGHWTQPNSKIHGMRFASPVKLFRQSAHKWVGNVVPLPDEFTMFLKFQERSDGRMSVFLRNPERNIGVFMDFDHLDLNGKTLSFIGKFRGRGELRTLASGSYDASWDRIMLNIPNRGGTYVFERVTEDESSTFFARGRNPKPFEYTVPIVLDDGWQTQNLTHAGMDFEPIKRLIETQIDTPAESVHASYIHGLVIARNGNLVFEKYFHGFHRDKAHDTRSASKSLTSTLIGAAIEADFPISTSARVYETMMKGIPLTNIDPRAHKMTVEHLLTMSSGLFCDDSNPDAPGGEDRMQEQEDEPDWYRYTLNVPMETSPGEEGVYCSANPNLAGGVLNRMTDTSLETLFQDLIAEPLQMDRYYLNLSPTGEPYMGGGIYWLPRDFLKLGQLMLDGGVWNGRRILSRDWVERAVSPLIKVRDRDYGYLWWVREYEHNGKSVRAFFAGGNGGNIVVVVPDLDLVVAFFGGNYSDRILYRSQDEFIPNYILPAVIKE